MVVSVQVVSFHSHKCTSSFEEPTHSDARIQPVQMIRAAQHEDAVVRLQAVDLVQEVGSHAISHNRVQVLQDEVARSHLSSLGEDDLDRVLWSPVLKLMCELFVSTIH